MSLDTLTDASPTPLLPVLSDVHRVVLEEARVASAASTLGSLSMDGWSNARKKNVFGVTITTVDADRWELHTIPLGLIDTRESSHSARNVRQTVLGMLDTNPGVHDSFLAFASTTDGASNMLLASRSAFSSSSALRCVVHTISLVVKNDVLEKGSSDARAVAALIDHLSDIAVSIRQHPKCAAMLEKAQVLADVTVDRLQTVTLYNNTRWYSRLACAESYISLHARLVAAYQLIDEDVSIGDSSTLTRLLNESERLVLAEVVKVLREVCFDIQFYFCIVFHRNTNI